MIRIKEEITSVLSDSNRKEKKSVGESGERERSACGEREKIMDVCA
jgi:hypothetical protein